MHLYISLSTPITYLESTPINVLYILIASYSFTNKTLHTPTILSRLPSGPVSYAVQMYTHLVCKSVIRIDDKGRSEGVWTRLTFSVQSESGNIMSANLSKVPEYVLKVWNISQKRCLSTLKAKPEVRVLPSCFHTVFHAFRSIFQQ